MFTRVYHGLYSLGLDLTGVTGSEEMTDTSRKHKQAGIRRVMCLDGEHHQRGSVGLFHIAGQGGGLVYLGSGVIRYLHLVF